MSMSNGVVFNENFWLNILLINAIERSIFNLFTFSVVLKHVSFQTEK